MDNLVDTRTAASIYGCSVKHLLFSMNAEKAPREVVQRSVDKGGRRYLWNPHDVLRVRAIRTKRFQENQAALQQHQQNPKQSKARSLLARNTQLERERNRRLTKIATARGTTVKELRIALGIDKG